jgi:hypothetical protein
MNISSEISRDPDKTDSEEINLKALKILMVYRKNINLHGLLK